MLRRLVEYFSESSIHGLHYITDSTRHISERVFWAVVCAVSLLGAGVVLRGNIYNFENNAVSFVMETTYLNWNTTFPAISVCEVESTDKLYDTGERMYGPDRNMNLDFYLRDIAFYYGTCYTCSAHCGKTINCSQDFDHIIKEVRSPCQDLIDYCKFNGKPFKCCRYFRLLETEKGPCYTINSMHLKKPKKFPLDMTSNLKTGPGKLEFTAFEKIKIVLHAPEDVPFLNHPQQEQEVVPWGNILNARFMIKEIENDRYVKEVSVGQRNCRFPSENYLRSYALYSYSACVVDCRAQAQVEHCNCTHHFMPKIDGVHTCNLTGLICLSNVSETLRSLRTADYTEKQGLVCDCLPSCTEPEYSVVSKVTAV
ncbi:hypothetical protein J6590_009761 [Homalodisca vitripennis]|nr:hypothetical protein J6590_009761 [Homalodisca vitripennis]